MVRRFGSFEELAEDFIQRDGIALRCISDEGFMSELSYAELGEMMMSESYSLRAECSTVEVIEAERTIDTVVRIFACVIADCDIILAEKHTPEDVLLRVREAAVQARSERERLRDSRGRLFSDARIGEILFATSGTTSRAKIVRLNSGKICTSAWCGQQMLPCMEGDVILSILPFSHVFGFVCSLIWPLAYGATVALGRGKRYLLEDMNIFRPTILPSVPSYLQALIKHKAINRELYAVLSGAAPCPPRTIEAYRKRGISVYIGYGMTETSSGVALSQELDEPEALTACPEAELFIESPDEDGVGEISVSTPCMMLGYMGSEPMLEGDRFFTGDIGFIDEKGRLHIRDRINDVMLIADGTKIYCPEVEEELKLASGVQDLGLILKGGHPVLIAGPGTNERMLRQTVAEYNSSLPRSKRIQEVMVSTTPLPRTVTGKLKRYALQERYDHR